MNTYDDWNDNIYFNCSAITTEACGVPSSCCSKDKENKQCGYGVREKVHRMALFLVTTNEIMSCWENVVKLENSTCHSK